jgi:MFS transporter, PAT family, beta-lactamase induction signal transducer AmpG
LARRAPANALSSTKSSPSRDPARDPDPDPPGDDPTAADRQALDEDRRSGCAVAWVASTYFAEGLPYSIVHQVSMELFTSMGASAQVVGLTALYGLPWNLKFLWGPLMDRYGTLRRWAIVLEVALAVAIAAIAWPAQGLELATAARLLLVVAVLAAAQDVAVDGFYMRALGKTDQAALSGLRAGAFRVAMLVGKGGLVIIAGRLSWRACFFTGGAVMLLLAVAHAFALPRERASARSLDRALEPAAPSSPLRFYLEAFRTFVAQPGAWISLSFILVYRAGDAMMFAMSSKLLDHLGISLAARGDLNAVGGVAGIAGSMVGGVVIARLSLKRTLPPIALGQGLAILLYVAIAARAPTALWISAAVIAERVAEGVGSAALVVFLMRRCAGEYRASHFAIASAAMSIATTGLGSVSGFLLAQVGYPAFFALAYVATIPGIFLARIVPKD